MYKQNVLYTHNGVLYSAITRDESLPERLFDERAQSSGGLSGVQVHIFKQCGQEQHSGAEWQGLRPGVLSGLMAAGSEAVLALMPSRWAAEGSKWNWEARHSAGPLVARPLSPVCLCTFLKHACFLYPPLPPSKKERKESLICAIRHG